MEQLFASFQPMDDVINLLSDLRQAGLFWIADEIETAIRNGNALSVTNQRSNAKDYKTVPFDAREQLWLALRTIRHYTVDMYEAWNWTQSQLRQSLDEPGLHLSIISLDGTTEMPVFEGEVGKHLIRLGELLERALSNNDVHH